MERVNLVIEGMGCRACVSKVTKALGGVIGVTVERVATGSATVLRDPARAPVQSLIGALTNAGYRARTEVSNGNDNDNASPRCCSAGPARGTEPH